MRLSNITKNIDENNMYYEKKSNLLLQDNNEFKNKYDMLKSENDSIMKQKIELNQKCIDMTNTIDNLSFEKQELIDKLDIAIKDMKFLKENYKKMENDMKLNVKRYKNTESSYYELASENERLNLENKS